MEIYQSHYLSINLGAKLAMGKGVPVRVRVCACVWAKCLAIKRVSEIKYFLCLI